MQNSSELLSDDFVEFNRKLGRLECRAKTLQEKANKKEEKIEILGMEMKDCAKCRGDNDDNSSRGQPHIQDLCPADRERIAHLVAKLAECTKARHKAEEELAEIRSENEALVTRYEIRLNEQEIEKNQLKEQLENVKTRAKILKEQSSKSLDILGDQLNVQEAEFVKLTQTVKDLLREKIQLKNGLIERDSRMKILEAKLERAKETLEMEKLLFMKEHVKDSMIRTMETRGCQTLDNCDVKSIEKKKLSIGNERKTEKNHSTVKCKDDLEDPSGDAILLRSLFFKTNTYDENDENSPINVLYCSTKNQKSN